MDNLPPPKTLFAVTVITDGIKRKGWELLSAKLEYEDGPKWQKIVDGRVLDETSEEFHRDSQNVEADVRRRHPADFWYGGFGLAPV